MNLIIISGPSGSGKSILAKRICKEFKDIELNKWHGPYKSSFGHHIIFISNYSEGYLPSIKTVLKQVEIDYIQTKRDQAVDKYLNNVKTEYKIYINPDLQI